jgi:hypothetical protein
MSTIKAIEMVPLQWYKRIADGGIRILCVINRPPSADTKRHDLRAWNPYTETVNVSPNELVEPLIGCTHWDWEPEPTYAELCEKAGLKVGDRVKVTGKTEPEDWQMWNSRMNAMIGKTYTITRIRPANRQSGSVVYECDNWWFPCTSLEKVEPKYRPFTADEFEQHCHKWLKRIDNPKHRNRVDAFLPDIWRLAGSAAGRSWQAMLDEYTFLDGTPCGVPIEE